MITSIEKISRRVFEKLFGSKPALIIFLITFITFSFFFHRFRFWNVSSRLDLTYAIVEDHSFKIDKYIDHPHFETKDRAFYNGHYYSDKIIGLSLLAVPVYWVIDQFGDLIGKDFKPDLSRYGLTVCIVSLSSAFLMVVLFKFLLLLGQSKGMSSIVVLFFAFGTMLFPFSSLFYPYLPSLFFLMTGFYSMVKSRREDTFEFKGVFKIGLLVGASLLCEYTITVPAILISLFLLFSLKRKKLVFPYILAVCIPLFIFAIYNWICFDNPFSLPYKYLDLQEFQEGMSQGLMGVHKFQWYVLYLISFHPYRGLFIYSPFLILSFLGLFFGFKNSSSENKWIGSIILITMMYYFFLNASYYMWWGGGTLLTRHLIPMLPFIAISFAWYPKRMKPLLLVLGILSVILIGIQSVVEPHFEPFYTNAELYIPWETVKQTEIGFVSPFFNHSLPEFLKGKISMNPFNLEIYATERKWWTLFPLFAMEILLFLLLRRSLNSEKKGNDLKKKI